MKETSNHLALVILTHYHADHMSGFASNSDDFAQFDVGAVWITNRLDPDNPASSKFMAQLTTVAQQLQLQLGARADDAGIEARNKVENALGVSKNGGSNAKALKLLQGGFKNKPPVYYFQGGDTPILPDELKGMITAEILGPSPKDSGGEFAASDNKTEQYLTALGEEGVPDAAKSSPSMSGNGPQAPPIIPRVLSTSFPRRISAPAPRGYRIFSRPCSRMRSPPPPINWTARSITRASSCSSAAMVKNYSLLEMLNGATGPTGYMARASKVPTPASPTAQRKFLLR